MAGGSVLEDLATFGPERAASRAPDLAESRAYCRRLARTHYENFVVASMLVPAQLRPHFHTIYAYCRWADDLADETGDPARSLALLDWWEEQLRSCCAGEPGTHPVFVALADTVAQFGIPPLPFLELLDAFRQDQRVSRYDTHVDVLDYCRRSANPVGRLVLYLGRCHDEARAELSDRICTGLQLANFCQDVARDWDRGRIYLPLADCREAGYDEVDFASRQASGAFREVLRREVDRAQRCLEAGLPLADRMPRGLRGQIWLFAQGGSTILQRIRRADYDVWSSRPKVSRLDQMRLLAGCLWRNLVTSKGAAPS